MRILAISMMAACTLAGFIFLWVSLRELVGKWLRLHSFAETEAVVVDVLRRIATGHRRRGTRPMIMNFPVLVFQNHDGEEVRFISETGDTGPKSQYQLGQTLAILYDPAGRFPPMLATWSGVWLPSLMGLLSGCIFLAAPVLIFMCFGDRIMSG